MRNTQRGEEGLSRQEANVCGCVCVFEADSNYLPASEPIKSCGEREGYGGITPI